MSLDVIAQNRALQGTGASRRLRRAGKVPGILYGANKSSLAIEVEHKALFYQIRNEAFHASILTLTLEGKAEKVLLRDLQMHPFRQQVLHVDFQRVDETQEIHMKVPLHFINEDIAPGIKLSGGNISHIINEIEIICLPADLPEYIEVDLGTLKAGHSVHLSEVKLPKGVKLVALVRGEDVAIAAISAVKAEAATSEEAAS